MRYVCFFFVLFFIHTQAFSQEKKRIKVSPDLELLQLSENVFLHASTIEFPSFGKVICNGLIYKSGKEIIIMDTPPSKELSRDLIRWIKKNYPDVVIKGVIVNHSHEDCLAGLDEFHSIGVQSYSSLATRQLAEQDSFSLPQITFDQEQVIKIGNNKVVNKYLGEAHTKDNIVTWIPDEKILFGGCMVKSLGADKGNIASANILEWPQTISKVKAHFYDAKIIVPGHGQYGGTELLDYTIELFTNLEVK